MVGPDEELEVRRAAMAYIAELTNRSGGVVTRTELEAFEYRGEPIKLIDPRGRGIRNPRQLAATLSLLSQPGGPYDDEVDDLDGLLRYAYRKGAPDAGDNVKLRRAADLGVPLIMFRGIAPGVFVPIFPVYVVDDHPDARCVEVAVDESLRYMAGHTPTPDQRLYAERLTRLRLHQPVFRAQVLTAYQKACAICRLKHVDLLDAAHILPDTSDNQSSRTAWPCARSTMPPTTATSSRSVPTTRWRSGPTSSRRSTDPCCATAFRKCMAGG